MNEEKSCMQEVNCKEASEKWNPDPWKHRAQGMKCSTCMWFMIKQPKLTNYPNGNLGRCRRHAPTMNGYPVVFTEDWCGDHKLDENKL